jgi:hypothetical protein
MWRLMVRFKLGAISSLQGLGSTNLLNGLGLAATFWIMEVCTLDAERLTGQNLLLSFSHLGHFGRQLGCLTLGNFPRQPSAHQETNFYGSTHRSSSHT